MGGNIETIEKIPCPVCGSTNISQTRVNNGILGPGYHSWIISECCSNCGVMLSPNRKHYDRIKHNID